MITNLQGGLLRQRLTVLAPTAVSNGAGGRTNTWASVGQAQGEVGDGPGSLGGMEKLVGEQPIGAELVRIILDSRETDVQAKHRIQDPDGRVYEVLRLNRNSTFVEIIGRRV